MSHIEKLAVIADVSDESYGNDDVDIETGTTFLHVKFHHWSEERHGIEYQEQNFSSGTEPLGKTTTGKSWKKRPGKYWLGITKFAFYNAHLLSCQLIKDLRRS